MQQSRRWPIIPDRAFATPFRGLDRDLAFEAISGETTELVVRVAGMPGEQPDRRLVVYLGLFDALAEELVSSSANPDAARTQLSNLLRALESAEGPLRFARHEQATERDRLGLVTRMRGKEIALTRDWMVPKLREEIRMYSDRVAALREVLRSLTEAG